MVFLTYLAEAPAVAKTYKLILAGLRLCVLILCIWLLLPQFNITFMRDVWPDLIVLIDTSRSMGERTRIRTPRCWAPGARPQRFDSQAGRRRTAQEDRAAGGHLAAREGKADPADLKAREEIDYLKDKIRYWKEQRQIIGSAKWQPTASSLCRPCWPSRTMTGSRSCI